MANLRKKAFTQLYSASEYEYVEDVKVLICHPSTCLMIALHNGHIDVSKVLIQSGTDINAMDWAEYLIHFAVSSGRVKNLKFLIQAGVASTLSWCGHR